MGEIDRTTFFWLRRDLRLEDNVGLYHALKGSHPVVCAFIFDREILDDLEDRRDARVQFIHQEIDRLKQRLRTYGSDMVIGYGSPVDVWRQWLDRYAIAEVYANRDYEPYARKRDETLGKLFAERGIGFHTFKDQIVFDRDEVVKDDGDPYTVFTPYAKKWKARLTEEDVRSVHVEPLLDNLHMFQSDNAIPALSAMGFEAFSFQYPGRDIDVKTLEGYHGRRDFPAEDGTSRLGLHLRFGTIGIRDLTRKAIRHSDTFLNELIWRNFYQDVLWHFPQTVTQALKPKYDRIEWRNDPDEFEAWKEGRTGYPLVDAGMRQLDQTGYMHNRIRMVTASFLTKHLLVDWRWGEAWFARKLLDYDMASNVGGWQWAAGSGADAAPYFRIFNPARQMNKFDPNGDYVRRWVPEFDGLHYPDPIVEHSMARNRALSSYKRALQSG